MCPGVTTYNPTYGHDHFIFSSCVGVYNPLEHISEQVFKIEIKDVYHPIRGNDGEDR